MSEYWVSNKKYYCKYCEIYITDDAPSRRQHENGLRHQGNKERFVRGLYKASEKRKQDAEEEKRDMARVEQAAQAAFARDVGSGIARASSSTSSAPVASSSRKPTAALKPSSPWANYSTAESLGIKDPDEERRQAEAERRRTMGVAGEWQIVAPAITQGASISPAAEPVPTDPSGELKKRPAEGPAPDEDTGRGWKLKKKKLDVGLGELYDPGLIPIRLKAKKEEPSEDKIPETDADATPTASIFRGATPSEAPNATSVPKWSKVQWKKPGEGSNSLAPEANGGSVAGDEVKQESLDGKSLIKAEDPSPPLPSDSALSTEVPPTKQEEVPAKLVEAPQPGNALPASSGGSLFKKRKAPAGTAGARSRRGM
ncbi:hypothetical protein OE88DRAFT_1625642 [Heliocybe sulcata]|uniref:Matrin-type domain-containing protein n=1 Tax=Heliocybe sulcata TaxID=5364 RepID=A0A5C3NB09_9AGAM|nr:hypothetical protein OE88DRAFT_1625642 [Heliocybe sulcata]